jgi:hypothetical protein
VLEHQRTRGLQTDRVPASIDEARKMVAYNEWVLETSRSAQRRDRAQRMLANLQPSVARLEREELERLAKIEAAALPASSFEGRVQQWRDTKDDDEFEVVWSGKASLSTLVREDVH